MMALAILYPMETIALPQKIISPLKRSQTSATISSEAMLCVLSSFLAAVLGFQAAKAAKSMAVFQDRSYFSYR